MPLFNKEKRKARKLYKEIYSYWEESHLTKDEHRVTVQYLQDLRAWNQESLSFFGGLGPSVRHQVMNMNEYRHGLLFGFENVTLNEHHWLRNKKWTHYEILPFRVKHDKFPVNEIRLAQGPNGKWTFGLSYQIGTSGGGYYPSVFGQSYEDKITCTLAAIEKLTSRIKNGMDTKKNIAYGNHVLDQINHYTDTITQQQLALF